MSWDENAACLAAVRRGEASRDDWFPNVGCGGGSYKRHEGALRAVAICAGCPVKAECEREFYELPRAQQQGIWFGKYHGPDRHRNGVRQRSDRPARASA